MSKVTYYVGAGASYYSLPTVNEMEDRIRIFRNFLNEVRDQKKINNDFLSNFINELNSLIQISRQYTSLDSYAKTLAISTDNNARLKLLRLKIILNSYLLFEQLTKPDDIIFYEDIGLFVPSSPKYKKVSDDLHERISMTVDKRYMHFWARHINDRHTHNLKDVNIISWNYDLQFELSFAKIRPTFSLHNIQQELQIFPSKVIKSVDLDKSCILKLNGTAGLYTEKGVPGIDNLIEFESDQLNLMNSLDLLIKILEMNYNRESVKLHFSFAWENDDLFVEARKLAQQIVQKTKVLISIGYSFPEYNLDVDRIIFADVSNVEKIYVQVRREDEQGIRNRIRSINRDMIDKLHFEYNLDHFYYSHE